MSCSLGLIKRSICLTLTLNIRAFVMKTLIINRKRWLRGKGVGSLLTVNGYMCCLGFACRQLANLKPADIMDCNMPVDAARNFENIDVRLEAMRKARLITQRGCQCPGIITELSMINDCRDLTEAKREKRITSKFRAMGVKVKFTG